MIHTVHLSEDLVDLLVTFANAYEQKNDQGQKETIMFSSTMGGTRVQHFGFEPNASFRVNIGDLQELDQLGLIDMSYGGTAHAGNFGVTSAGYHAVEQIKEQNEAIASAAVVPTEGPGMGMGMDWETQTFPILKAVYDLWSKNPTGKGVSQPQINAELRRAGDDALTSVVLRKLEEADFVTGKIDTDQIEGPLFCEPTTKAFEFLAGWPSARADAALARLVASLEAKIEATEDPEEKGKLKRLLAGVQEVGQSVMVNVFTNVITGAI